MESVLDIPVQFGGVSIGEATARLGVKIDRSVCSINAADDIFCGHRLNGRVVLGGSDDQPGQTRFLDTDDYVDGVFDVKRFGANSKEISTGLTFSLRDVDVAELAKFSKGSGRLIVNNVGELPEDSKADDDEGSEEIDPSLEAAGPWQHVPLSDLFHGALLKSLNEAGLNTVGDMAKYTAANRLTDIDGIGEGKAAKIEERMLEFWRANPGADQQQPELDQAAEPTPGPEASGDPEDWRQKPLDALGLTNAINDMLAEMKVTTVGGLSELVDAINDSRAVWPKGIGPMKAEEIQGRLLNFRDRHEPVTA